jgi:hypothetical protein
LKISSPVIFFSKVSVLETVVETDGLVQNDAQDTTDIDGDQVQEQVLII